MKMHPKYIAIILIYFRDLKLYYFVTAETNNVIPEVVPGSPDVHTKRLGKITTTQPLISEEGLILPRKPLNPCLENPDRQNLHRELLFNQKM